MLGRASFPGVFGLRAPGLALASSLGTQWCAGETTEASRGGGPGCLAKAANSSRGFVLHKQRNQPSAGEGLALGYLALGWSVAPPWPPRPLIVFGHPSEMQAAYHELPCLRVESVACLGGPQVPPAQYCSLLPLAATVRVGMWVCVREPASRPGAVCVYVCAHLAFVLYKLYDVMCLCTLWLCVHVCKRGCGCGTQAAVCSFCLLDWALVLRATGVGLRRECWLAEVAPVSCLGQAVTLTTPFYGADQTRAFSLREQGQHCLVPGPSSFCQTREPPESP